MERIGVEAALAARQRPIEFGALLAVLAGLGEPRAGGEAPRAPPAGADLEQHLAFIEAVLLRAEALRERALARLSASERRSLFDHAAVMVRAFTPQHSGIPDEEMAHLEADRRFCEAFDERIDSRMLVEAAEVLLHLSHESWLDAVVRAAMRHSGSTGTIRGVTGRILASRDTRAGRIVVGGPGENSYALDRGIALVLDVGGADLYRGAIAAAGSARDGNRMVIDVAGDDRYEPSPLGLATGRLAVGGLVDASGDDTYRLAEGSGGTGFAGIGMLYDLDGSDRYLGAKLTQGAAIAGLGLLVDRAGQDELTSDGYGIGFGGPLGVGAVVEAGGDDRYACGGTYPSAYNAWDAPEAEPGDAGYQYQGFCLGIGVGVRVLSGDGARTLSQRAGGVGFLIDVSGNDHYQSSNFSQGAAYLFGAGVMLDLAGDDRHLGARYGQGAAAHHGVGLFVDAAGRDLYRSSGPVFNGGTAWDYSVALFLDAGLDDDVYDLSRSDGLGRAAHRSWSVFAEEGGNERYTVSRGLGLAGETSVSGFFDLNGVDSYAPGVAPRAFTPGNGRTVSRGGGLFVDR